MNPSRPLTVLIHEFVTGGGLAGEPMPESWAVEGAAMRRALAADFAAGRPRPQVMVTMDPRLEPDEGPWESVVVESLEQLAVLAHQADYTLLIAPETDGVLERLTRFIEASGASTLGSPPHAVAFASDKAALGDWFRERGVDAPHGSILEPGDEPPAGWTYPAVVKPVDGAGAIDTYVVNVAEDVGRLPGRDKRRLLQELVPGTPMSALFLIGTAGTAKLLTIGVQRIASEGGRFEYLGGRLPEHDQAVNVELLMRAVRAISCLRGLVGVDFIDDSEHGRLVVVDVNPRPTTSCVALLRLLQPGRLAELWALQNFNDDKQWSDAVDRAAETLRDAEPIGFNTAGDTW